MSVSVYILHTHKLSEAAEANEQERYKEYFKTSVLKSSVCSPLFNPSKFNF